MVRSSRINRWLIALRASGRFSVTDGDLVGDLDLQVVVAFV